MMPRQIENELAVIHAGLIVPETEETWQTIFRALGRLTELVGNVAVDEVVHAVRPLSQPINDAILSERSRLSGGATDLIAALSTVLGRAFDPLLPLFLPSLLALATRTNKVFNSRARICIIDLVHSTQSPIIISYLVHAAQDKSVPLRRTAVEAALACLNSFNPPDLQKESRSKDLEAIIRSAVRDANPDIRKVGRSMFEAYRILLPQRVESFTGPLTPTTKKYLNLATYHHISARSNPPSRPPSSQSTYSASTSFRSSQHAEIHHPAQATVSADHYPSLHSTGPTRPPTRPSSSSNTVTTTHKTAAGSEVSRVERVQRSAPSRNPTVDAQKMPPPKFLPSYPPQRRGTANRQPPCATSPSLSTTSADDAASQLQRAKPGPLRPTTGPQTSANPSQSILDANVIENPQVKRAGGGARRVLLPDPSIPVEPSSDIKAIEGEIAEKSTSSRIGTTRSVPELSKSQPTRKGEKSGTAPLQKTLAKASTKSRLLPTAQNTMQAATEGKEISRPSKPNIAATNAARQVLHNTIIKPPTMTNAQPGKTSSRLTQPTKSQLARVKPIQPRTNDKPKTGPVSRTISSKVTTVSQKKPYAQMASTSHISTSLETETLSVSRSETPVDFGTMVEGIDEELGQDGVEIVTDEREEMTESEAAEDEEVANDVGGPDYYRARESMVPLPPSPPSPVRVDLPIEEERDLPPSASDMVASERYRESAAIVSGTQDGASQEENPFLAETFPSMTYALSTPQSKSSRPFLVEQTPISALVESIQQGFLFTPGVSESFTSEDSDGDSTFRVDPESSPEWKCPPLSLPS